MYEKMSGILANRKPLMCIALAQTCIFTSSQTCIFGRMRGKLKNNISCRKRFFSYFLIWRVERIEEQKYNIKNWVTGLLREM